MANDNNQQQKNSNNDQIEEKVLRLIDDFIDDYLGDDIDEVDRNVYRIKFLKGIFLKAMANFNSNLSEEDISEIDSLFSRKDEIYTKSDKDDYLIKLGQYINQKFPNLDERFLQDAHEYLNDVKQMLGVN